MTRIVLVVNAEHDDPTSYLGTWSRKVVRELQGDLDIKVVELTGIQANKVNVINAISRENPSIIILNGHGDGVSIRGHNQNVLVRVGEDLDPFIDKVLHAMACKSASVLGDELIRIGSRSFIGYREDLKFVYQNKTNDIDREADGMAALFLNPAFTAVIALMKGEIASQAYKLSQHEYAKSLSAIINSNHSSLMSIAAAPLYHNMKYQTCLER